MKRLLIWLLVPLLLLSACAAPAPDDAAPTATAAPQGGRRGEPVVLTLGLWELEGSWENEDTAALQQYILDTYNVQLRCYDMSVLNDYAGQVVGAVLPDVFTFPVQDYAYLYQTLVDMGRVRDVPYSLYADLPRLTQTMGRVVDYNTVGQRQYYVPRTCYAQHADAAQSVVIYYRRDWAEALSVGPYDTQAPTWAQFMDMLRAFTHGDPNGNAAADTRGIVGYGEGFGTLWQAFVMPFGVRDWVLQDGTWVPGYLSDRGKLALTWFNEAYRLGYLEPNWQQYDMEGAIEAFCAERAGMLVLPATCDAVALLEERWAALRPEEYMGKSISVLPQPTSPTGTSYNETQFSQGGILFNAALGDEELRSALQVIEYLSGGEGLLRARLGVAGQDYTTVEGKPLPVYRDAAGNPQPLYRHSAAAQALATLATYALDGTDPSHLSNYQQYALAMAQTFWWGNSWRSEMFTDYITDVAVTTFHPDGALEAMALQFALRAGDVQAQWAEFATQAAALPGLQEAQQAVNAYAQARGITAEE